MELSAASGHGVSIGEAFRVWLRVAALSFGGPAGQIAVMHRILVEEKRWIGEARFLHALSYCTLLPGPEATQLAIYIGWLMHRTRGGVMAGTLFVLPGIVALMALSYLYAGWGKPRAGSGVILRAEIGGPRRRARGGAPHRLQGAPEPRARDPRRGGLHQYFFANVPFPVIVLGAGLIGYLGTRRGSTSFQASGGHTPGPGGLTSQAESLLGEELPDHARPERRTCVTNRERLSRGSGSRRSSPCSRCSGRKNTFTNIAVFFTKMAVVSFGGAYAVLAYVAQQAVEHYHWLRPGEMLDGLGLAETTPGPLIMVTQFVGFMAAYRNPGALRPMLAGTLGGLLTTWVTFAPCFLWIFLGAPFIERLRGDRALSGALSAVTAAVVGVILNLAVWFALHTWFRELYPVHVAILWFDAPVLRSLDPWALGLLRGGDARDLPLQDRHDFHAARLLRHRRSSVSDRRGPVTDQVRARNSVHAARLEEEAAAARACNIVRGASAARPPAVLRVRQRCGFSS